MLIILYGDFSEEENFKQQRMINGQCTCGYREYAKNYGHIIYLSPQTIRLPWEHSITDPKKVIQFISNYPDAIVWSVKHSPKKDKEVLSKINNKKVYYSCCSNNMYNSYCNVSLVDTRNRIKKNAKLWFKGKDSEYWAPNDKPKKFDYLLMGRRGDKNEIYFLKRLNEIKKPRRILWIGGEKHKSKIVCNHEVITTPFIGQDETRNNIIKAKVGVLFTELKAEGFPQSFLEMTICGLPVVYNEKAPKNEYYFHKGNHILCSKKDIVNAAEKLLKNRNPELCRRIAIHHYNLEKSYRRILSCIKS